MRHFRKAAVIFTVAACLLSAPSWSQGAGGELIAGCVAIRGLEVRANDVGVTSERLAPQHSLLPSTTKRGDDPVKGRPSRSPQRHSGSNPAAASIELTSPGAYIRTDSR